MYEFLEDMILDTAQMVRPPERLTVPQAAEKYVFVNNPGNYVGPWSPKIAPYMNEPGEVLTSQEYTAMIFVGPAQSGKTDFVLNWIAHSAVCDPADMMIVQMSQAAARDFSKRRVDRLHRNSVAVGERVMGGRNNQNTFDVKYKSGMLLTLSWPTITELSGKPVQRLWLTDYDRMPENVDGEGSPFDLAFKRTTTFRRFGMTVAESSPGRSVENAKWVAKTAHEAPPTTGILALYNRGDRRRWYWECMSCGTPFEPDFHLLDYPPTNDFMEAAEAAVMRCPHCNYKIEHTAKKELNLSGRWVKDGEFWRGGNEYDGTPIRSDTASFWLKGAAAAFSDWRGLVLEYLTAMKEFEDTGSEEALKTTINTAQGLPYTPKANESNRLPEELKARAEDWGGNADAPVVPEGVRFLVATVDVQAGGRPSFVVHVHGYGEGSDVWEIDMFKIRKSPTRKDKDDESELLDPAAYLEDWDALIDQVIEKSYPLSDGSGRRMAIKMTACDSGGREGVTTNAYNFWRKLKKTPEGYHRRFVLVKGDSSKSAPRTRVGYPDSGRKDRNSGARGDVPVLFIQTNLMKDQCWAKLGRVEAGGGVVHFPVWAENWLYTQLTAEVRQTDGSWDNPSKKRNESWDLLVYAEALTVCADPLVGIRIEHLNWAKPPVWAAEWDRNAMVFRDEDETPLVKKNTASVDLSKLGQDLG